jgi:hypothetical protein
VTKDLLQQILCYHQVAPTYLDFLTAFGSQDKLRDLTFGGFREHTMLKDFRSLTSTHNASANIWDENCPINPVGPAVSSLGRTAWGYQISYNLKAIESRDENQQVPEPGFPIEEKWSFRQAAFHHQFDVVLGTTLWITTSSHEDIQNDIEDLTGPNAKEEDKSFRTVDECFRTTLSVHLLFCHWGTRNWRSFIRWLEDTVRREVRFLSSHIKRKLD